MDVLFDAARSAMPAWADAGPQARVGVCLEIVQTLFAELPLLVPAVMHTAGQSTAMSYAGSGTNALDRGIEAIVYAHQAMDAVTPQALWERRFGAATIRLRKRFRLVPRGVAVCFTCATFPTWNAFPAMFASLATGNAVIVKPHPTGILPMALAVRVARRVLADSGFDPNLVTLAVDSPEAPLGMRLVKHPGTAIVDFTGSARFGAWVEQNAHPALSYTETSGVNTVVLESMDDLERGRPQPRHHDEPVLGADVHFAAEHLPAAQRHGRRRPARRRGRGLRRARGGFPRRRRRAEARRLDPRRRPVARRRSTSSTACATPAAGAQRCCSTRHRTRTRTFRQPALRRRCCSGSQPMRATCIARSASAPSAS